MKDIKKKNLILIADDDKYIRDLLTKNLESNNYEIMAVNSGEKLIGLIKKRKASVVITDIYMDNKGGFEVVAAVKKANNGVPVIVITGNSDIKIEREIREMGVFSYFVKPIEMDLFKKTIQAAISSTRRICAV